MIRLLLALLFGITGVSLFRLLPNRSERSVLSVLVGCGGGGLVGRVTSGTLDVDAQIPFGSNVGGVYFGIGVPTPVLMGVTVGTKCVVVLACLGVVVVDSFGAAACVCVGSCVRPAS